jgi:hypothetical protein
MTTARRSATLGRSGSGEQQQCPLPNDVIEKGRSHLFEQIAAKVG